VQERMQQLLLAKGVRILVCSPACGEDLIALQAAKVLSIPSRTNRDRFRSISVIDRPGDCGPLFDRIITAAMSAGS
jgi:hypothetical protein